METSPLEAFYTGLSEPVQSAYLYIRSHILKDEAVTESYKWKLPFFDYKGKYFCYLWQDKKSALPYVAFTQGKHLDHPALVQGDRTQIAVLHFDPRYDLPMLLLVEVLMLAKRYYDKGA